MPIEFIVLASGIEVSVMGFNIGATYAGVLCGTPESVREWKLEDLKDRVNKKNKGAMLIEPPLGRLPPYTCSVSLHADPIGDSYCLDYSCLTVYWFADKFPDDLVNAITERIHNIDWAAKAEDWII